MLCEHSSRLQLVMSLVLRAFEKYGPRKLLGCFVRIVGRVNVKRCRNLAVAGCDLAPILGGVVWQSEIRRLTLFSTLFGSI
jgi:hypothetical protein